MCRYIVLLSFLSLSYNICIAEASLRLQYNYPYTPEELCADADNHTLRLILNFLYWSYRRSASTIQLQHHLRHELSRNVSQLRYFYHLRLNPERSGGVEGSCEASYQDDTQHPITCQEYEHISHAYAKCCKTLLSDTTPLPHTVRDRLTTLRNHVRGEISAVLATKLMHTYYVLGSVYSTLQTLYSNFGHLLFKSKASLEERGSSLFSTFWSYVPSFLINIMYQFEDKHLEIREQLCDAILEDIDISDDLWTEIESLRTDFYQTMYTQVYHYVANQSYDDIVFADYFSPQAHTAQEPVMLPHPYELDTRKGNVCH